MCGILNNPFRGWLTPHTSRAIVKKKKEKKRKKKKRSGIYASLEEEDQDFSSRGALESSPWCLA